jgi:hypothetical protein
MTKAWSNQITRTSQSTASMISTSTTRHLSWRTPYSSTFLKLPSIQSRDVNIETRHPFHRRSNMGAFILENQAALELQHAVSSHPPNPTTKASHAQSILEQLTAVTHTESSSYSIPPFRSAERTRRFLVESSGNSSCYNNNNNSDRNSNRASSNPCPKPATTTQVPVPSIPCHSPKTTQPSPSTKHYFTQC